jgi:hypothetical protein
MNLSASQPVVMSIIVVKGSNISSPIDAISVIGSDNGTSSVNVVTPSISTIGVNDLLVGFVKTNGTETFSPGPGFTLESAATVLNLTAETEVAATPGAYTAMFTLSSGVTWQAVVGAVGNNPNQATLSWTASTESGGTISAYLVERCQGALCSNFAQVGTTTTTTFSDPGLVASTTYSYRVRAQDSNGITGPYSATASVTTPAAIPAAPGNLTATPISTSQVNVSWTPSTETNGTIANYFVERCQGSGCTTFAQVGSSVNPLYNDTALAANTTYSYRIRAVDAVGNMSPYSGVVSATTAFSGPVISYVQSNYATPQTTQSGVTVKFNAAQNAGDLNVVAVGWNDSTTTVSTVTDTSGNIYSRAVGPTIISGVESQSIYYAKNIAGAGVGANAVTVTFSKAASFPDVRILEYAGADPSNPVDGTAANSGTGTTSASGSATTTNPTDLIFGANLVQSTTGGPGAGFIQRILTSPDSDIAEDEMVTAIGSYAATAPISSGQWIMQMVAFRTPSGGTSSVTVTSVSPNSGSTVGGTAVTITGTNFASGAAVTVGGAAATNVAVLNGTTIAATTPAGSAGAATVTVTVGTQSASLSGGFSYLGAPTVTSVSPSTGSTSGGTAVTITGTNFAAGATVTFGTAAASNVVVTSSTTITATTPPQNAGAISVTVTVGGQSGTLPNGFTYSSVTTISYVQGNYATPQSSTASITIPYTAAQLAGDLNVVVVGWNDSTASVSTVTDSSKNTYTRAVGPTTISGALSQSIYYAKNIAGAAAGANTVTVTFSSSAAYPDIRILEYSGADPANPVDVTGAATGNSTNSSSGSLATTYPTDLLFGANIVQTMTSGPGAGFVKRLLTSPDGDIAEDEMVTAVGSYSATATLSSGGLWIMQAVAFRSASGGGSTPAVTLSTTSINFGNVQTGTTSNTQPVTITNTGSAQLTINTIGIQGGSTADFSQTNNCGVTLAPNVTCTIQVTFTPGNTGAFASSLAITDNAPNSPQSVSLSGTGTGLSVTPRVSVLTFTRTQQFTASGSVTWSVDGILGGSASAGTISPNGLYTPPAATGTHTVTATESGSQSASATVYVTNYAGTFTYHNDNLRTGQNLGEAVLTAANVNQNQFGKLFSYPLDGISFASPLYVANVSIPGQGFHNVVYVATENDSVYAFDADGLTTTPLWHVTFLGSGRTPVPCSDTGECGDIPTQIGITSTPTIDQTTGTIYVVAATKEGGNYVQRLHALDITTGAEKFGGPVALQASLTGKGSGSSGGQVAFDSLRENQRPGLLLSNDVVYLAFGSHGDISPWHGWVLGYNATTLQQTMAYNATPNGNGGGIWQGGGALATDSTGDIYFVTSNGDFNANTGGPEYGDSVEKVSPSGAVVDYFTPHDQANMDSNNLDLGAGGPVMLVDQSTGPYPHLLITSGKTGTIYVINRDNMGKYNANNDNQIVQSLPGVLPNGGGEGGNFSTPVFFNQYVYFGAVNDTVKAFQMTNGLLSAAPTSQSSAIYGIRGASFAISANGSTNGILWALQNNGTDPNNDVGSPGILFAYDANNLATELYDSGQAGSRDTMDNAAKFSIPLVANGKVFVAGQTQLTVYGLLP